MSANSKLYIASKEVLNSGYGHLYLVYDEDGNLGTLNDQKVIRGGNDTQQTSAGSDLMLEIGVLIQESADLYGVNDSPHSRGTIEISVAGQTADSLWDSLLLFANSLGAEVAVSGYTEGLVRNTGLPYDYIPNTFSGGFNSNSTIASFLSQIGVRLEDVTPLNSETPLDPNDRHEINYYPDYHNQYGGTRDDKFLLDDNVTSINGRDGIDVADFSATNSQIKVDLHQNSFLFGQGGLFGSIENVEDVIGTRFDDTFKGNAGGNIIEGRAGNDIFIYNYTNENSLIVRDEYLGGEDYDTVKFEFTSAQLTADIKNELLQLYRSIVNDTTPLDGVNHNFSHLNLDLNSIESIELYKDGTQISLATEAKDDVFRLDANSTISGNLFGNNGNGADYTLSSTLVTAAGTYSTTNGGSITISANGDFTYNSASNYYGYDELTYDIIDIAGGTSTANVKFIIHETKTGTAFDDSIRPDTFDKPFSANGGDGNDHIVDSNEDDYLAGGSGDDDLTTGAGNDIMIGGDGNDSLNDFHYLEYDELYGGDGDDYILARGNVTVYGGNGNDEIELAGYGGWDDVPVERTFTDAGSGDDEINYYNPGEDIIYCGDGNDVVFTSNFESYYQDYRQYVRSDYFDGGEGTDELNFDSYGQFSSSSDFVVDLAGGYFSEQGFVNIISNFENVTGTQQDDLILGDSNANVLNGNHGNDILNGRGGNDIVRGYDGDDTLRYSYNENIGATDYYYGEWGSDTLELYFNSEDVTSAIFTDIQAYYNFITNPANIDVNASSGAGYQFTTFGLFASRFESLKLFVDGKEISLTYTLGTNAGETITGNSSDNTILAVDGDDTLNGLGGNDLLNGGVGADTMYGGTGDDLYIVDNILDAVIENASEGTDTVESSVSYGLSDHVENLILTGSNAISATGNFLNNEITGNSAHNIIDGGTGNDTMMGKGGDDTYIVDSASDVVTENANEGNDTIRSNATYTLAANVENLTLLGNSAINGTGNALDNIIIGNSGNNIIAAGAGNDIVNAGNGNDTVTYIYGENIGSRDYYSGQRGNDTLELHFTTAEYTLSIQEEIAAYRNYILTTYDTQANAAAEFKFSDFDLTVGRFENVKVFVDSIEQSAPSIIWGTEGNDYSLTGTSGADVIMGKGGDDTLDGGAGNDTLNGGTGYNLLLGGEGDDTYILTAANLSGSGNVTYIQEYLGEGTDTLLLSDLLPSDIFTYTDNNADYFIRLKTETTATVISWANTASGDNEIANYIEHIKFADGTVWNLSEGLYLNDSDDSNFYMAGSANNDIIHMNGGNDGAYGGAGNDYISGGAGNDYVYGADGNDTLAGNDGIDELWGGSGADVFVFEAATAFNDVDTITDFTVSDGDKLDLSDLLIGFVPGTSDINDFLSFTADTWNKTLVVDRDGTGTAYTGEEIVVINNGVSQVGTIDDLFNNGHIDVI